MIDACKRCGKVRRLIAGQHCSPCYVRLRYEAQPEAECVRCGKLRKPFGRKMCKSCYSVLRLRPEASLSGSDEHRARLAGKPGQRREASPKWKGGRFVDSEGYVRVLPPEDYAGPKIHGGRYVHEHRLVATQKLGRPLLRGEIVHHVNGIKTDNRPENLEVMASVSAHRLHHAAEFIRLRREAEVQPSRP